MEVDSAEQMIDNAMPQASESSDLILSELKMLLFWSNSHELRAGQKMGHDDDAYTIRTKLTLLIRSACEGTERLHDTRMKTGKYWIGRKEQGSEYFGAKECDRSKVWCCCCWRK
jgi:hypothetical protein